MSMTTDVSAYPWTEYLDDPRSLDDDALLALPPPAMPPSNTAGGSIHDDIRYRDIQAARQSAGYRRTLAQLNAPPEPAPYPAMVSDETTSRRARP